MRRVSSIGCLAFVVLALAGGTWYAVNQVPAIAQQLPQNNAPLMVSLTRPRGGDAFPVSGGLVVNAEALGAVPISRLELWADGALAESYAAPLENLHLLAHTWRWTPGTLGEHTLYVRAIDRESRDALSNVVHLRAIADAPFIIAPDADKGTPPARPAPANGGDAAPTNTATPGPRPTQTGVVTTRPDSPAGQNSAPANAPAQPSPPVTLDDAVFWLQKNVVGQLAPTRIPAAPSVQAITQGCGARLVIADAADNESGFFVYRLAPQASAFVRIAQLEAHGGDGPLTYDDGNLSGSSQYYVSAFNPEGEAASNIAGVKVEPVCGQSSSPMLTELISADIKGVERPYLYLTADGQRWTRVPVDANQFLDADAPVPLAEASALLAPGLSSLKSLSGEAWGWRGGALVFLGAFKRDVSNLRVAPDVSSRLAPPATLEARGSGTANAGEYLWLKDRTYASSKELAAAIFRWSVYANPSHGRWQVSVLPFSTDPDLNPPGLLLSGDAPPPEATGTTVEFPMDLSGLVASTTNVSGVNQKAIANFPPFASPLPPGGNYRTPAKNLVRSPLLVTGQGPSGTQQVLVLNPDTAKLILAGVRTFYVRIMPMNGNQVIGKPSNSVVIHYDPSPQDPVLIPPAKYTEIAYDVKILNFTPPHFPESKYEYCVVVTKFEPTNPLFLGSPWALAYKEGFPVCPEPYSGQGKSSLEQATSDLGNLLEAGVNFVSDLYSKLDAFVKGLVAKALCAAPDAAKKSETIDKGCQVIANYAVDAVKAYFGLPPSLPNYDQLKDLGKDYMVEMAAQEMEDNGVPCPEECKDLLRKGIDYTVDQIKAGQTSPACLGEDDAHDLGIEPLCPPKGVDVKPYWRGQYAPALVEVRLTRPPLPSPRQPGAPPLKACSLSVTNSFQNNFWPGKQVLLSGPPYNPDLNWQGKPLSGQLFVPKGMPVPLIAERQSITLAVPIEYPRGLTGVSGHKSFNSDAWLPEHLALWKSSPYIPETYVWMLDWFIKYHGAQLTLKASMCGKADQHAAGPFAVPFLTDSYGPP